MTKVRQRKVSKENQLMNKCLLPKNYMNKKIKGNKMPELERNFLKLFGILLLLIMFYLPLLGNIFLGNDFGLHGSIIY